jgi:pyruvate dehydrogenase E1 component
VLAVSDYMRAVPDQISRWVQSPQREYTSLGTDGFGFADTRGAARRFFHVDAESIVVGVLAQLARRGEVKADAPRDALERYQLLDVKAAGAGTVGGDA